MQLTELTENINDANALLAEQQSITTQLQVKVESQLSLRSVEDYAQNQLGMQNAANNPITYISLANGDKAGNHPAGGEKLAGYHCGRDFRPVVITG